MLQHRPTGIQAEASERRQQAENRRVALFRLRLQLALNVRASLDDTFSPSTLWQSRCRGGRVNVSVTHTDFPAMLAEALDFVCARDFDIKLAARDLGCTPSQLLKLLGREPKSLLIVNEGRVSRGLPRLKL